MSPFNEGVKKTLNHTQTLSYIRVCLNFQTNERYEKNTLSISIYWPIFKL